MKLLRLASDVHKTVKYLGITLTVPATSRFIATDSDGRVYWYRAKPKQSVTLEGIWENTTTKRNDCGLIGYVDLEGKSWTKTLKEL